MKTSRQPTCTIIIGTDHCQEAANDHPCKASAESRPITEPPLGDQGANLSEEISSVILGYN